MAEPPLTPDDRTADSICAAAGSVTMFLRQLCLGDQAAVRELWVRFLPRMHGLARKTLARHPQRAADADDAVQSAFVAFWQHAQAGRLSPSADRNDLWNLLGVMTVRKSLKQVRRAQAEKRGGGAVSGETEVGSPAAPFRLDEALATMPTQEFDLLCEELLMQLSDELREVAVLRLMGHSNREIAALWDCTDGRFSGSSS